MRHIFIVQKRPFSYNILYSDNGTSQAFVSIRDGGKRVRKETYKKNNSETKTRKIILLSVKYHTKDYMTTI